MRLTLAQQETQCLRKEICIVKLSAYIEVNVDSIVCTEILIIWRFQNSDVIYKHFNWRMTIFQSRMCLPEKCGHIGAGHVLLSLCHSAELSISL